MTSPPKLLDRVREVARTRHAGDGRLLRPSTVVAHADGGAYTIEQLDFHPTTMASSSSYWQCRPARKGGPDDFATVIKAHRLRDEIVECSRLSDHSRLRFPVNFCTGYADSRRASIREMEDIAWVLRSDLRRNEIGFVKASRLKPEDRYVLPGDWD